MDNAKEDGHPITRYVFHMLFKHKLRVLVVFLTIVVGVTAWSLSIPRTYEAYAKIIISFVHRNGEPSLTGASRESSNPDGTNSLQEQQINSEVERLKGGALIAKAIADVGIANIYPSLWKRYNHTPPDSLTSRALTLFRDGLTVKAARNSNIITIKFTHNDPIVASRVVNALIGRFVEYHTPDEQDQQITSPAPKMENEGTGSTPLTAPNTVTVESLKEQENILVSQISEIERNLNQIRDEIRKTAAITRAISLHQPGRDATLEFDERTVPKPQAVESLRMQLAQLKAREQDLLRKYTEKNFQVVSVREDISELQRLLAREEKAYLNSVLLSITTKGKTLEAKAENLKGELRQQRAELAKIRGTAKRLIEQERRRTLAMEKTKTAENRRLISVEIAEPAMPPAKHIRPNRGLNISLALASGLVFGLGTAIISERLRPTFSSAREVEQYLGLPVLASITERTTTR